MKKICVLLLAAALCMFAVAPCFAAPNGGNPAGVSQDMLSADFWKEISAEDPDKVLLTLDEIEAYNAQFIAGSSETWVRDLENMEPEYDAAKLRKSLAADAATPSVQYYVDGKAIDSESYYQEIRSDIESTGFDGTRTILYAVASSQADIKAIPTNDMLMDSLTDTADEMQSSSMLVNEPFVIKQKCEREGTTFYWGYSQNVTGWVDGASLAICKDRDEWLEAWKINDISAKDFIVITQDKAYLDKSTDPDYPAGLCFGLGTVLKLVEPENIPATVAERGTWANYVVYVPARDGDGNYVRKIGLLAAHYSVSEGYLPYTQANLLDLAFSCQGNRYGWGNMFGNMDCSGYVRNILRCFGFNFPRNTTTQRKIDGADVDLRGFNSAELAAFLKTLPAGTLLFISGHSMIYIGTVDDVPYVISSVAILADSEGELKTVKYLSVLVTPLTVRRANGYTWLWSLQDAVVLPRRENIASFDVSAYKEKGAEDGEVSVSLSKDGKALTEGTDYLVMTPGENGTSEYVTVMGVGSYTGIHERTRISYNGCVYTYEDVSEDAWYAAAVKYMIDSGLMSGVSSGRFAPDDELTRAQMAAVLYKLAGSPQIDGQTAPYADVAPGAYYEKASRWAKEKGIFAETEETGAFNADLPVSRRELVAAMYRMSGAAYEMQEGELAAFCDAQSLSGSYASAFAWAVSSGLISGYTNGTLGPDNALTRAQFASVLYRIAGIE